MKKHKNCGGKAIYKTAKRSYCELACIGAMLLSCTAIYAGVQSDLDVPDEPIIMEETTEIQEPIIEDTTVSETETLVPQSTTYVETTTETTTTDYHHDGFNENSNVMSDSGLSENQIDELIAHTDMAGSGSTIKAIEREYNVNAFYTMAVSTLESGAGSSNMAQRDNNLFGLMGKKFDSQSECIEYFGGLMVRYDNAGVHMSPAGINPTYCTEPDWSGKVTTLMNQYTERANQSF